MPAFAITYSLASAFRREDNFLAAMQWRALQRDDPFAEVSVRARAPQRDPGHTGPAAVWTYPAETATTAIGTISAAAGAAANRAGPRPERREIRENEPESALASVTKITSGLLNPTYARSIKSLSGV